jgi:hypothetical protein
MNAATQCMCFPMVSTLLTQFSGLGLFKTDFDLSTSIGNIISICNSLYSNVNTTSSNTGILACNNKCNTIIDDEVTYIQEQIQSTIIHIGNIKQNIIKSITTITTKSVNSNLPYNLNDIKWLTNMQQGSFLINLVLEYLITPSNINPSPNGTSTSITSSSVPQIVTNIESFFSKYYIYIGIAIVLFCILCAGVFFVLIAV